jgi:hypothetical protein
MIDCNIWSSPEKCGNSVVNKRHFGCQRPSEHKICVYAFTYSCVFYTGPSQTFFFTYSYFISYLLTYLLTPWSRFLLKKLTGFQLVKDYPHLMEPEGSFPQSQVLLDCFAT